MKPPLKWAGGKRWQLPRLSAIWDADHRHRRLVEPFCGAAAVTIGLSPECALLNDINPHVINFYRWLKRGLTITMPMKNESACYYAQRERFNQLVADGKADTKEAARSFYYLNRTGYNGLCRTNQSGGLNVPFGQHATINYARDFTPYRWLFAKWEFISVDFEKVPLDPEDFVYADPPHDGGDKAAFTQYAKQPFGWNDQVRAPAGSRRARRPSARRAGSMGGAGSGRCPA